MSDESWSWEKTHVDEKGYERREKCMGVVECPVCGEDLELISETEEWTQSDSNPDLWVHSGWGPAMGVCCDHLVVDSWDGCEVYDLSRTEEESADAWQDIQDYEDEE